jgi:glucose/mannose-6-phosphate isomerase
MVAWRPAHLLIYGGQSKIPPRSPETMPTATIPGATEMRALAVEVPAHFRQGFKLAQELDATIPRKRRRITVVGMGGSAIAADLVRSVTDPELDASLDVGRGPSLPRATDKETLVVCASFSGNTWETLAAYDEAGRRGASRVTIGSGGELARRADRDGVPHLQLPPLPQPRAAVGYMLGGLFGVLDPFFPESTEGRVRRAAERVSALQSRFASTTGAPATVARRIGRRTPEIYADVSLAGLARRWKTQIEENAKRLAHFDLFPELLHNAIVGWDALTPTAARGWAAVLLDWPMQSPAIAPAVTYLERLLKARGVAVVRVRFDAEDRIESILIGVSFGDHVSLELARAARVDPMPVEAIARMKKSLGRT